MLDEQAYPECLLKEMLNVVNPEGMAYVTKWGEHRGWPSRVCEIQEIEYVFEVSTKVRTPREYQIPEVYYCFVMRDEYLDSGKSYFELYPLTEDDVVIWKKTHENKKVSRQLKVIDKASLDFVTSLILLLYQQKYHQLTGRMYTPVKVGRKPSPDFVIDKVEYPPIKEISERNKGIPDTIVYKAYTKWQQQVAIPMKGQYDCPCQEQQYVGSYNVSNGERYCQSHFELFYRDIQLNGTQHIGFVEFVKISKIDCINWHRPVTACEVEQYPNIWGTPMYVRYFKYFAPILVAKQYTNLIVELRDYYGE